MECQVVTSRKLSLSFRLSYGVGHILNDLTASVWFSFLLVYLERVKHFSCQLAGDLMLIGQISDAVATPLVGYGSDRSKGLCGMGKRKTWHFVGTLCVACSFVFLFNGCLHCEEAPDLHRFFFFCPFVIIFQIGWASIQVSHLSLIPDLTPCESQRTGLYGLRYAVTGLSNLTVYGITWLLFASGSGGVDTTSLGPKDQSKFRDLSFIVTTIGVVFSFIFYIGTRENTPTETSTVETSPNKGETSTKTMSVADWASEPQFYLVGLLYMCSRLFVNLSQVYLPMYLMETLDMEKEYIAIVPLIVYISGFCTSLLVKYLNVFLGRKISYFLGFLFAAAACVWIYFIPSNDSIQPFIVAVFIGIGGATVLVTSLGFVSGLIAENTESGAFVFGVMSCSDKLSNGISVAIIQNLQSHRFHTSHSPPFFRTVQSVVPGSCVSAGLAVLGLLLPQTIGERRRDKVRVVPAALCGPVSKVSGCENDETTPLIKRTIIMSVPDTSVRYENTCTTGIVY